MSRTLTPITDAQIALQWHRLDLAATILASWRPTGLAGEEQWRQIIPAEAREGKRPDEPSLTPAEYRRKCCRQALAWADALLAAAREGQGDA